MNNLEEIKNIDIKHIIEKETSLHFKTKGNTHILENCPICSSGQRDGGTSAFSVKKNANYFKCFSCDAKGSPIDFIMSYKKINDKEAIKYLSEKYTDSPTYTPSNEIEKANQTDLSRMLFRIKKNDITPAKNYLISRGIDVELLPPNSYYYNPPYKSKGEEYPDAIIFLDSTETLINKRFIGSKEFRFQGSYKGKIYDRLYKPEIEKVWLHEGVINALSMPENSCISLFTAGNHIDKPEILKPYIEDKIVILCGDNDTSQAQAGQGFNKYYSKFIQKHIRTKEILICKLPPDTDHNDLKQQGRLKDFNSSSGNFETVKGDLSLYTGVMYDISGIYIENKKGDHNLVSDFHIYLKYQLYDKMNDTTDWIIELARTGEPSEFLRITNDEWCSVREFKKALSKKQFIFLGNERDLELIKKHLGRIKQAKVVSVLGHDEDSNGYFFSNKAFYNNKIIAPNQHDIVELNGTSFYMPYIDTNKKVIDNSLRFIHVENSNVDFKTWYNLYYQMWDNGKHQHAVLPTAFYIASLYLDFIFKQKSFFPIYYVHGISNSGKSSLGRSLTCLSGYKQKDINLKQANTAKSLPRIAAQISNAITWFDEYHTELSPDIKGICQSFFDRAGYNRAELTSVLGTNSIDPKSALFLTSNFVEKEDFYLTRYIYHVINEKSHTDSQFKAKKQLDLMQSEGLSSVSIELLKYRDLVISNWENDSKYVFNQLIKKCGNRSIHSRLYENMTLCLTPAYTLIKNGKISLIKTIDELMEIGKNHILHLYKLFGQTSGIDDFWDKLQTLAEDKIIKHDIDYKIDMDLLYLRFQKVHGRYEQRFPNKSVSKDIIKERIETSDYYKDYKKSTWFGSTNTSAMVLDYEKLKDEYNINFLDR